MPQPTRIWDGTNYQRVLNPQTTAGTTNVAVGLSATLLAPSSTTRQYLGIYNRGTSAIFLGINNSLSGSANIFARLEANTNREFTDYSGDLYGILVNGVSGNAQNIGIMGVPSL